MFKKLNYQILFVLLLILAAAFLITKFTRREERTFKKELVSLLPEDITEILFNPDPKKDEQVRLFREQKGIWKVYSDGESFNADTTLVNNMINSLVNLKPERVAATDDAKWPEFQVDDSAGIHVHLLSGKEELANVIIGKFSYKPQQGQQAMYGQERGKMSSYVRLDGEKEVYAVDGFLRMTFQSNINSLRDKALVRSRRDDITRVTFTCPDNQSYILEKQGTRFAINGVFTDSTETVRYLTDIARLSSQDFVYDIPVGNTPDYSLKIESNNAVPMEIQAFTADTVNKYILTASANPGTLFSGYGKNKLFERVFVPKEKFAVTEKGILRVN